ncbi:glucose-6-phosphate dehydrogenase [Methylobacterium sp. E-016]|uniref:glucose-6-phosphate dehydrogenase n=1 Tax=Methylobacterium sp. E-016 TaxID=2836556 RepID=UPI001FB943B1|nr:glucose-6-phosphate dehydrogenase [Methylobacterium sp. E-016]MCJ2075320.1 glucose-6-phosphate dehydrogenase [Methylobacterium sp. E-016]
MATIIPVASFDYVVFGATGDLTTRKLLPALYHRYKDGQIPATSRIIGASRSELAVEAFRARTQDALKRFVAPDDLDPETLAAFLDHLDYVAVDGAGDDGWTELVAKLDERPDQVRPFYLATSPDLYGSICRNLAKFGLVGPKSRVVLEKPIGKDLTSARAINDAVGEVFPEEQIFRIDHYLGKETVQNLLALRFANTIFDRLWTADVIDHVQITVAETVGVEGRAGYYDTSGALRDMLQNHILQLLCLTAMESPLNLDANSVRDEKLKVLRALKPITAGDVQHVTVRGQYVQGAVDGKPVEGYLNELGHDSRTETFVACKVEVQSWRWAGVPFYLRTGKRLPQKLSEIVVQFRAAPFSIFPEESFGREPNRLVIRLQPQEGMKLEVMTKDPGPGGMRLRPTNLDISFEETFKQRYPDAYERLLMDVVRGNATLFMRRDEVEVAWAWADSLLKAWADRREPPRAYPAGSWGPTAAIALIERDGRTWHEELG